MNAFTENRLAPNDIHNLDPEQQIAFVAGIAFGILSAQYSSLPEDRENYKQVFGIGMKAMNILHGNPDDSQEIFELYEKIKKSFRESDF